MLAVSGVRLPRWYWLGLMVGTAAGAVFVHWLIFETLYRIGALCPCRPLIGADSVEIDFSKEDGVQGKKPRRARSLRL